MARKKKCPEHVDHERWLVSYADFITLLFAFFVVMYATASVNLGKYKILSDSLYGAFTGKPRVPEPIQIGIVSKSPNLNTHLKKKVKEKMKKNVKIKKFTNVAELVGGKSSSEQRLKSPESSSAKSTAKDSKSEAKDSKSKAKQSKSTQSSPKNQTKQKPSPKKSKAKGAKDLLKQVNPKPAKTTSSTTKKKIKEKIKKKVVMGKLMAKITQKLKKQFSNLINKERVKIRHNNKFIAVELNNHFFFKKGEYLFNKNAIPVVGRLVDVLKKFPNFPIIVEGHTSIGKYDETEKLSGWELSALRAAGLVHLLTDFSISPERLTASSFASFKPAYDNKTPKGRVKNRRTTILIKADPQNTEFLRLLRKMPDIDYENIYDHTE
jgi:chemotaxis protein MotB